MRDLMNPMPVQPEDVDLEELVSELAELPEMEYESVRQKKSKEVGIRVSVLDKLVRTERGGSEPTGQGKAITYPEIEPWSEPLTGVELFDELDATLARHMSMSVNDRKKAVLWIAHAHCFEVFTHSPRLVITAPDKECGKTVLLSHLIGNLVPKSQHADNLTPAVFFRLAESHKPTFLIDEVDAWLKEDSQLPGSLNGGFERHGVTLRCEGNNNEVRQFSTFAPTAMAGIQLLKKLPSPTLSRSIVINLQRATANEVEEYFDQRKHQFNLLTLKRKLARWIADNLHEMGAADPDIPALNRIADKWRPLITLADQVGGKWSEYARATLLSEPQTDAQSRGELLLKDIDAIINMSPYKDNKAISTEDLISELCGREGSVWSEYNFRSIGEQKQIQPRQLSNLLSPYNIKPTTVRIQTEPKKGYKIADLRKAIERYRPTLAVTPLHSNDVNDSNNSLAVTPDFDVTDRKCSKPNGGAACNVVTHINGDAIGSEGLGPIAMLKANYSEEEVLDRYGEKN